MKNISPINAAILLFIIIAFIAVIVHQAGPVTPQSSQENAQVKVMMATSTSQTSTAPKATVPKTTTTYVAPAKTAPITNSQTQSYSQYVTQLSKNQDACNQASKNQYTTLYGNLSGSAYTSFYNQINGRCYVKITGSYQAQYSTTTTGYIYFRDASTNTPIAECVDPTGTLYSNANWNCTNKVTGATINKAEFDALIYSYTTK